MEAMNRRPGGLLLFALCLALHPALAAGGRAGGPGPEGQGGTAMKLEVRSTSFSEGGEIPRRHTCDGEDLSPALAWGEVPAGTASLALICDDPDAPVGTWVHWVLFDLPPETRQLAEALSKDERPAGGGVQGVTDFRRHGYGGPCPPRGPAHRYFFKLYALDRRLGLGPEADKAAVVRAMEGHVLAEGRLMGRYRR
jgi:Raf kinase inhibitor-like YbhB/YbcL family protein